MFINRLENVEQNVRLKYNNLNGAHIITNIGRGNGAMLVLLDLSASFDTTDYDHLFCILENFFGIRGNALKLIKSYFSNHTQCVQIDNVLFDLTNSMCGVPQRSVLGPLKCCLYLLPLSAILMYHKIGCCCCLPTPMALASGGSPMFPLVVHQPASPSFWPAVQSLRRGLSTNPGATMIIRLVIMFMLTTLSYIYNLILEAISKLNSCLADIKRGMITNKLKILKQNLLCLDPHN